MPFFYLYIISCYNHFYLRFKSIIPNQNEPVKKQGRKMILLRVTFSGRVGGAQAWEEAGEKEKEARMEDGREEWEQA